MLGFLEDIGLQFLLLLVAGIIWVIGRVVERATAIRKKTRETMEREEGRRGIEWTARPQEQAYAEPTPEPDVAIPIPPVRPPRRPPRRARKTPAPPPSALPARRPREAPPPSASARSAFPVAARLRKDPRRLREAVVLREVLGPPRAFRHALRRPLT